MKMGTFASRSAGTAPFSSPKLGRHRITPSNRPSFSLRNRAYMRPSSAVSMAPFLVSDGSIASHP